MEQRQPDLLARASGEEGEPARRPAPAREAHVEVEDAIPGRGGGRLQVRHAVRVGGRCTGTPDTVISRSATGRPVSSS